MDHPPAAAALDPPRELRPSSRRDQPFQTTAHLRMDVPRLSEVDRAGYRSSAAPARPRNLLLPKPDRPQSYPRRPRTAPVDARSGVVRDCPSGTVRTAVNDRLVAWPTRMTAVHLGGVGHKLGRKGRRVLCDLLCRWHSLGRCGN
jgi:hypothetical protein